MSKTPEQPSEGEKTKEIATTDEGELRIESKEAERLPPVLLIYRDNELFTELVPEFVAILKSLNRKVEIKAFPQGTGAEEIAEWTVENESIFVGKEIVADDTLISTFVQARNFPHSRKNMDRIFDDAATRAIVGKEGLETIKESADGQEQEEGLEDVEKVFVRLLKKIFENPENIPDRVVIMLYGLLEHHPFREYREKVKEAKNEDEMVAKRNASQRLVAETIKSWLVAGGVAEGSISFNEGRPIREKHKETDEVNKKSWQIIDRHVFSDSLFERGKARTNQSGTCVLNLPLVNFYQTVKEYGLIKPDPEALKRELKGIIVEGLLFGSEASK